MYNYDYYDYSYGYEEAATGFAGLAIFSVVMWLVSVGIGVFTLVCMWKVFKKAGKPGWAAIVPIYNIIVMLEIAELPMWYIALFCVPFANIYAMFKIYIEFAHKFGKSTGFGVGMVFLSPIFLGILAFGKDSNYQGVQVNSQPVNSQPAQPMNMEPQQPIQPQPMVQPVPPIEPVMPEVQPVPTVEPTPIQPMNMEPQQPVNPQPVMPETQPVQPQFCTKCGAQTLPGSKFCVKCGNQL